MDKNPNFITPWVEYNPETIQKITEESIKITNEVADYFKKYFNK